MVSWRLLIAASIAFGGQGAVTDSVKLRYIHPSRLAQVLRIPADLEQITFNLKEKSISVRGPRSAVQATLEQVFELDSQPSGYRVHLRVVKRIVDEKGEATERLIGNPWASVTAGSPVTFSTEHDEATGQTVTVNITPRRGGKARLEVTMKMRDQAGNVLSTVSKEREVALGEKAAFGGMSKAKTEALRRAIENGERPRDLGPYTAYYVELTTTSLTGE
jgi:hypothetical protein